MKKALIVIDMLKDFIERGGVLFCGKGAQDIVPFIKERCEQFRKKMNPVIFLCDAHEKDDLEFKLFPKHCVKGTKGAELIDELKLRKSDFLVQKSTFDGMFNTDLENILKEKQIEEVYLVGVCTSICVMETASSLIKRGYRVFVYREGVADFDSHAHDFALKRMKSIYGVKII